MVFLISIGVGAVARISWNVVLGALLPVRWDGEFTAYLVFVGIIGYLFGRLSKEKPWLWAIGIAMGHFVLPLGKIRLLRHGHSFIDVFFVYDLIWPLKYCWPAFIGTFLGYGVMRLVRHLTRHRSEQDSPP